MERDRLWVNVLGTACPAVGAILKAHWLAPRARGPFGFDLCFSIAELSACGGASFTASGLVELSPLDTLARAATANATVLEA